MSRINARTFSAIRAIALLACVACAHSPAGSATYAQALVDEVVPRHPDLKGMELALLRGEGCVTIAATDRGDVGDRCDAKEKGPLRTGEPWVEEPTRKDPIYDITQALHDATGKVIGAIIMDISAAPNRDRAAALARADVIRREVESRIPSAAWLAEGTPAVAPEPKVDVAYDPKIDARNFVSAVTNPYFPLIPGTVLRYRGTGESASETNVITVTNDTREILGVRAIVVRDQVFEDGELSEDTYDWFAQDAEGNVWYLGEDTKEYRNGRVVTTAGSWEAGVNGAKPGIIMWANPAAHIGQSYRQEYLPGEAEDWGKVIAMVDSVTVPFGRLADCVRIEDTTPLEPNVRESKYYCRGVGVVKEVESAKAGSELVAVEKGVK